MPIAAMMSGTSGATIALGTKTETKLSTGERLPSYSYTGAVQYACRFFDRAINPRFPQFGEMVDVDAIALTPVTTPAGPLALTTTGSGQRQQCQITDTQTGNVTTWEILRVRNLGNKGRLYEIALKRWVL